MPFPLKNMTDWLSPDRFLAEHGDELSGQLAEVLACDGSLTRRLEAAYEDKVEVRLEPPGAVLHAVNGVEFWPDLFNLPGETTDKISRNAWLSVKGEDRVFAYSQLDLEGLPEDLGERIRAGTAPLGSLFLESQRGVSRDKLELARLHFPLLADRLDLPPETAFLARRSLLMADDIVRGRILEILLPAS